MIPTIESLRKGTLLASMPDRPEMGKLTGLEGSFDFQLMYRAGNVLGRHWMRSFTLLQSGCDQRAEGTRRKQDAQQSDAAERGPGTMEW